MIGDEVTVTILGVRGNQVRIGINAPKSVPVHREEVFDRIKREKEFDAAVTATKARGISEADVDEAVKHVLSKKGAA